MKSELVERINEIRKEHSEILRDEGYNSLAETIESATAEQLTSDGFFSSLKMEYNSLSGELGDIENEIEEAQDEKSYNPERYFDEDENFKASWLADDIRRDYTFKKLRDSEQLYVYKDGYYQDKGEQVIEEECNKRLGDKWTSFFQNEVKEKIRSSCYVDRHEFRPPKRKINLKNGVYDLEEEELLDHSPEFFFTHKIPVNYNQDAECPNIHEFLNEIVETEEDVKTLREIAGYLLLPDYAISKAFMLIGKGSNGKSLYLELLKKLVGARNYTNKSLQELEEQRFATHQLYGKLACFDDDLPSDKLKRTSKLKKLTGGSDIAAEVKYGDSYDFKNFAKLVYACNELPRTEDDSDGFYRRWILVEFPYKFTDDPEDEHKDAEPRLEKMQKLTQQEELEGFLWWAIEALKDVLENNEFTYAPTSDEARKKWRKYSKPLVRFIEKFVVQGTTLSEAEQKQESGNLSPFMFDYVRKDFFAEIVGDYCEAHSQSRPSKKAILKALDNSNLQYGNSRTSHEPDNKQVPIYSGLKLRYNPDQVAGLRGYSDTFTSVCAHDVESSKQSVQVLKQDNSDTLSAEIESKVKELAQDNLGVDVETLLEGMSYNEDEIEAKIEEMKKEGQLFEPQSGQIAKV
ncbi:MAG: phage/plasmid primase, P4 family [Candidatus Nanohaloarchaea archaeon]